MPDSETGDRHRPRAQEWACLTLKTVYHTGAELLANSETGRCTSGCTGLGPGAGIININPHSVITQESRNNNINPHSVITTGAGRSLCAEFSSFLTGAGRPLCAEFSLIRYTLGIHPCTHTVGRLHTPYTHGREGGIPTYKRW